MQAAKEEQGKANALRVKKKKQQVYDVNPPDSSDDSRSSNASFKKMRSAKIAPEEASKRKSKGKKKVPIFKRDSSSPHISPRPNPYSKVIYRNKNDYEHAYYGQEPFYFQNQNISFVPVVTSRPPQNTETPTVVDQFEADRTDDDEQVPVKDDVHVSPGSELHTNRSTADEGKITIDNLTNDAYEKSEKTDRVYLEGGDVNLVSSMKTDTSPTNHKGKVSFPRGIKDVNPDRLHVKKKQKLPSEAGRVYSSSYSNPRRVYANSTM